MESSDRSIIFMTCLLYFIISRTLASQETIINTIPPNFTPNVKDYSIFTQDPNITQRNKLLNSGQYWENYVFQKSTLGMDHVNSIEHYIPISFIPEYLGEFDLWPKSWLKHSRSMPKNVLHHISYVLFTPKSSENGELIIPWSQNSMTSSTWNSSAETKILIHDYLQNVTFKHMPLQLKDAYFEMNNTHNIITVNWGSIAQNDLYFEAAIYGDLIGNSIGTALIILWKRGFIRTLFDVHVIGFGMGAHIAGSIATRLKDKINVRVGRITGLDPLGPGYFKAREILRLNYEDADFVDIIHTSGAPNFPSGEVGIGESMGDADFYPNGGISQPICESIVPMFDLIPICNHLKAVDYFRRSVQGEVFKSCKCLSWGEFDSESCKCEIGAFMGEYVKPTIRGRYYLHVFEYTLFELFKKDEEENIDEANITTTSLSPKVLAVKP